MPLPFFAHLPTGPTISISHVLGGGGTKNQKGKPQVEPKWWKWTAPAAEKSSSAASGGGCGAPTSLLKPRTRKWNCCYAATSDKISRPTAASTAALLLEAGHEHDEAEESSGFVLPSSSWSTRAHQQPREVLWDDEHKKLLDSSFFNLKSIPTAVRNHLQEKVWGRVKSEDLIQRQLKKVQLRILRHQAEEMKREEKERLAAEEAEKTEDEDELKAQQEDGKIEKENKSKLLKKQKVQVALSGRFALKVKNSLLSSKEKEQMRLEKMRLQLTWKLQQEHELKTKALLEDLTFNRRGAASANGYFVHAETLYAMVKNVKLSVILLCVSARLPCDCRFHH